MLNVHQLLRVLDQHEVRYVMFGTLAAIAYGARLSTRDLDLCPALDGDNLARIARVLATIKAVPRVSPGWMTEAESAAWTPSPATVDNLDHDYETAWGMLDVCPYPYGSAGKLNRFSYESLHFRAETLTAYGVSFQIAHVDDVVASKLSARREKDFQIAAELKRVQIAVLQGTIPTNIAARFDALLHQ